VSNSRKKRTVVITGAGSGLGASLSRQFSEEGFHVCLLGRDKEKLSNLSKKLSNPSSIYSLDVSDYDNVKSVFKRIFNEHKAIDILINNAGVGFFRLIEDLKLQEINQMIDTNIKGTIFTIQEVIESMKNLNRGIIINIVSTAGLYGKEQESAYCASKFGVKGLTESLREELKDTAITVFAVYMDGMGTAFWDGILTDEDKKNLLNPDIVAELVKKNALYNDSITSVQDITIALK